MKIKNIEKLKLPEGVRVPYFSGLIYRLTSNAIRKYITVLPIGIITDVVIISQGF